jgi:hypothetical protein
MTPLSENERPALGVLLPSLGAGSLEPLTTD